jgi:hypothetical protein
MTDNRIIPPPELVQDWLIDGVGKPSLVDYLAAEAAQWGADQELEACCDWLHWQNLATHADLIPSLRAARRPKPLSLKEQALEVLGNVQKGWGLAEVDLDTIRRALNELPDN